MYVTYTYLLRGNLTSPTLFHHFLGVRFSFVSFLVSFHFLGLLSSFLRDAFFPTPSPCWRNSNGNLQFFTKKASFSPAFHALAASLASPRRLHRCFLHKMKLYCIFLPHFFVFSALWLDTELLPQQ